MIPYEELDRALGRWKARAQGLAGGAIEVAPSAIESEGDATPMPIPSDELGSIPNAAAAVPDGTGELDVGELEAYEDEEA
jgi:hypothetical protein